MARSQLHIERWYMLTTLPSIPDPGGFGIYALFLQQPTQIPFIRL